MPVSSFNDYVGDFALLVQSRYFVFEVLATTSERSKKIVETLPLDLNFVFQIFDGVIGQTDAPFFSVPRPKRLFDCLDDQW